MAAPKMSPDPVSVGDVLALSSTGLTGVLVAGALVDALADSAERAANLFSTGLLVGIALGHPLLVRPIDHTVGEAGILLAAAGGGAYAGAQLGSVGSEEPSAGRVLALAAVGSAAAIWLMEKRFRMARPTPGRRVGVMPGRSLPRVRFEPASGALTALRAPGNHALLRVTF